MISQLLLPVLVSGKRLTAADYTIFQIGLLN
jgi:hypothetical protein